MENNLNPQPSPPPQVGGVWLSHEEYERLRATTPAQAQAQASETNTGPIITGSPTKANKDFWTYIAGAAAVLLFLGMSFGSGSVFSVPMVIALIAFTILAIKSLMKPSQVDGISPFTYTAPTQKSKAGKIVLLIIGLLILVPMAPFILMILFLIIMSATGQEVGS